jgi:hypothetical protein
MATIRQIQANRANAKRSTGPASAAGKKASSQNAVRHGLIARAVVLKAESTQRFEELLASFVEEFQPRTANEHALVETLAVARWRLMRNWMLITALLETETANQDPQTGGDPVLAAMAFRKLADSSQALHLLQRYETALDRQYSRALNNLLKVRGGNNPGPKPGKGPAAGPKPDSTPHNTIPRESTIPNKPPATQEFPNEAKLHRHGLRQSHSIHPGPVDIALRRRRALGVFSSRSSWQDPRARKIACY